MASRVKLYTANMSVAILSPTLTVTSYETDTIWATETDTTIVTVTAAPAIPPNGGVPKYGQCGGQAFTGETICASGLACSTVNPYYYQCT